MSNPVTPVEFARLCGVNRSTVSRWLRNGRIAADAQGLLDPATADRMRAATESPLPHHQARKAQFDEARAAGRGGDPASAPPGEPAAAVEPAVTEEEATPPAPAEPSVATVLGEQLRRATIDLQRHKAEREALEVDKLRGAVLERAQVDFVLDDVIAMLRNLLEALPDRLSGMIAAHQGDYSAIHKTLEEGGRDLLGELGALIKRRMETLTP